MADPTFKPKPPMFDPIQFSRELIAAMGARRMSALDSAVSAEVRLIRLLRVVRGEAPDVETYLRLKDWIAETNDLSQPTEPLDLSRR